MTEQLLFWVFAILTCCGAMAVVANQNVVHMAFWLVVSLGSVSALFFLMHADFLGAAQLLIYVGGTVVLLVFGVMLTASGHTVRIQASPAETMLGAGVGLLLLFVLVFAIGSVDWVGIAGRFPAAAVSPETIDDLEGRKLEEGIRQSGGSAPVNTRAEFEARRQAGRTVRQLGLSFFGLRPDRNLGGAKVDTLAAGFLLPFEIVSVHLLVVLVGAAYLARAKRRVNPASGVDL